MDRIKRLAMQVLDQHKDRFTADFSDNKKMLDQLAIVRSKGLKNEMAGFITKLIKREKEDSKEESLEEEIEETVGVEDTVEEEQTEETVEESEVPQEITIESAEESG